MLLVVFIIFSNLFIPHKVLEAKWSEPVRITQDISDELSPVFSPDGKKIAFTRRYYRVTGTYYEIVVMDLETNKSKVIFSPSDVKRICETGEIKNFSNMEVHRLAWHGNKIAFNVFCTFYVNQIRINLTNETCIPKLSPEAQIPGLGFGEDKIVKMVVINEDGSNPKIIGAGEHPYWSPDGEKILYLFKSGFRISACEICGKEIHELTLSTGEDRVIYKQNNTLFRPTYSPDGDLIVFERREDSEKKRNDIYLIDSKGNIKRLTHIHDNTYPAFTPDGSGIVFVSDQSGEDELYFLDLKSGELDRLTEIGATEACCVGFSPDGNKIVFSMLSEKFQQGFDIWLMKYR